MVRKLAPSGLGAGMAIWRGVHPVLRLNELKLPLDHDPEALSEAICRRLKIQPEQLLQQRVVKRSIDARRRSAIQLSYGVELALEPETWLVCFRPRVAAVTSRVARDAVSRELRRRVNARGRWMLNLCPMPAGYVFRAVFTNPLMTEAHVDELLRHLERCAAKESRT